MALQSFGERLALRVETPADADFLYDLYAATRSGEMALVDWSDAQQRQFLSMQFEAQSRHYREHFADASFDLIELDGVPIGRLYVYRGEHEFNIIDIALMPDCRGRGIGGFYLRSVLDEARAAGCAVVIHVEQNNPAMRLYLRLGFKRVKAVGIYWFMRWCDAPNQENTAS